MKRVALRRKRPGTRRGQPTKAEKAEIRQFAYQRARGRCELRIACSGTAILPYDGDVRERWHLVHLRNRRMWGWGPENICGGCARCHSDEHHTRGIAIPKTYTELKAN